jgi:hypothetical protein
MCDRHILEPYQVHSLSLLDEARNFVYEFSLTLTSIRTTDFN